MKKKIRMRTIADTVYVITILVLLYIGFAGVELNRIELWLPCISGMVFLFIIRREIINTLSSRAKLKHWHTKYRK